MALVIPQCNVISRKKFTSTTNRLLGRVGGYFFYVLDYIENNNKYYKVDN